MWGGTVEDYLSEREQWEWLKAQVRENAPAVVLALLVVAAGVFGWRWWQGRLDAGRLEAGARYTQILQALDRGDRTRAITLLGELERDFGKSPYADQARLLAARVYVDNGELERAAGELANVAERSKDRDLALVARLRLARVQIAQGKPDGALATLGVVEPGAFAARFHEVRGDADYAKGDRAAALKEYRSAQAGAAGDSLLALKIADLTADTAAPAPAQAASTTAKSAASGAGR
ncbi:MAG: tetratricopeptide repeat protein [Gammaproteobacteria bacterium]|nr:MAG: tetratricopeptide repeat protein [Gammaproteobacteria bacterium]